MGLGTKTTLFTFVFMLLCSSFTGDTTPPAVDKIVFKNLTGSNKPFSSIKKTVIEVRNNKLHVLAIDPNGDMLQIKDIPLQKVKNGLLSTSNFRTIYISEKRGTHHDDKDTNPLSLLEIKCNNNQPGNPITVGLKTTLIINKKVVRVYATLSGIIPSYTYTE